MKIFTFEECLQKADSGKKHLMLGNGFSVGIFPNIFNYTVLAEKVKSYEMKQLFEKLGTNDFEYVLRKLTEVLDVLECYTDIDSVRTKISETLAEFKETLINVISESHPPNPRAIVDSQYNACYDFLKHFDDGKKYTFNYDLLLYWVFMHFAGDDEKKLKCDDGFRTSHDNESIVTWEIGQEHKQCLYYIHGAMHVFSDGSEIEKYTWIQSGKTIREQVNDSLNQSKYPVFITEGTKEQKKSRINNNAYLGRCFSSLKSIQGSLFIYGHSLRDEDDHVFDFINLKSKLKNIFISLYGENTSEGNQKIINKVSNWQHEYPMKTFYFFDAKTAKVWGG